MGKTPFVIQTPDDILLHAFKTNKKFITLKKPDGFEQSGVIRLKLTMSGRQYDLQLPRAEQISLSTHFNKYQQLLQDMGFEDFHDGEDFLQTAYARAEMELPYLTEQDRLILHWQEAVPVQGGHLADSNVQSLTLGSDQFYALFFVPGSERWLADKEGRAPVPIKTGSIRAEDREMNRGALRLVEVGNDRQPTGWEAETAIGSRQVWRGALEKVPPRFFKASGFEDRKSAVDGIISLYAGMDRIMTPESQVTGVIFAPATRDRVGFRPS